MRDVKTLILLILAMVFTMTSCAPTAKQLVVTGATLQQTGQEFVRIGKAYDTMLADGTVTKEQYRVWATFAKHFKFAYPQTANMWLAAVDSGDKEAEKKASAAIAALTSQLVVFGDAIYHYLMTPPTTPRSP